MKKVLAVILVLALGLSLVACGGGEEAPAGDNPQSVEAIQAAGQLIMYTESGFPPYEYRSGEEVCGVDVEIAKAIAEDLGVELVIEDVPFGSIITSVQTGKAAIGAAGMSVTEERMEAVDFSTKYASSTQYVIVKAGNEFATFEDMAGMMIGVQDSTTGDFYVSDEITGTENEETKEHITGVLEGTGAEVKRYTNALIAAQDLIAGRLDAVVIDKLPALNIVAANANANLAAFELLYADGSDTFEEYAIAIAKDNPTLLEAVNATIERLQADGSIEQWIIDHSEAGAVTAE
ncbi:MAG: transporter substrate-binding domain-containing protein [Clostridia bacterium]|nr:transporter substrate-binding domain-containing protein [Clostridia bacterium]MDD4799251.1 transporter substrate-binding domain-containing protein [Clostridia bacterium]